MKAIAKHTSTLYVIGPGGSVSAAQDIMEVVARLLKAGGIAVKVETAGVAHTVANWQKFAAFSPNLLCEAYTALIQGKGHYSSCGMHNLGLSDMLVSDDLSPQEANRLVKIFLTYTMLERPVLQDGHTFSLDAQSPYYRLAHQVDTLYPLDHPFHNPFGRWHFSRV